MSAKEKSSIGISWKRSILLLALVLVGVLNTLPHGRHLSQLALTKFYKQSSIETGNYSANVKHPSVTPKFILYRIIGNDMPPLQGIGQLRRNTEYTLVHESKFHGCEKRWLLNRIVNQTEKGLILKLLMSFGYTRDQILDVPFDPQTISREGVAPLNVTLHPILKHSQTPLDKFQELGPKIRLFTQLNKARNEAISDGLLGGARWILCFDGNQFIPDFTWRLILRSTSRAERSRTLQYIEVPMVRLKEQQNPSWLSSRSSIQQLIEHSEQRMEEGQVVFRNDSSERFNENMAYSLAPKQDLLDRTCHFKSRTCLCHSTTWSWRVKSQSAMERRMRGCGATVRLFNFPEPQGVMQRKGDGNERASKRVQSAERFVQEVEALLQAGRAGGVQRQARGSI